jgi:NAD-dependent dihydropyrimidine dehydrogenase PreA subunit
LLNSATASVTADCITSDTTDRKLYIDPEGCIDCGSCEAACPNTAIFLADRLPPTWTGYAWVDAAWYTDPDAARAEIDRLLGAG